MRFGVVTSFLHNSNESKIYFVPNCLFLIYCFASQSDVYSLKKLLHLSRKMQ
jgi:hypothetical protein